MSLAIDPAQQRRGIGKILVKYGLEQAAKAGMDAFLISTPAGQRLYQSLGFRNVGEPFMMCNTPHYSMLWKRPADGSP
jgi:ribosomal protein S18 acetylase RimI-like enzyme